MCVLSLTACNEPISREQCDALLDHYVERLTQSDGRETSAEELMRLQRDARAKAARDPEFSRCTEEISKRELECALRAPSADEVERCVL